MSYTSLLKIIFVTLSLVSSQFTFKVMAECKADSIMLDEEVVSRETCTTNTEVVEQEADSFGKRVLTSLHAYIIAFIEHSMNNQDDDVDTIITKSLFL
jgi:hypothetical protein